MSIHHKELSVTQRDAIRDVHDRQFHMIGKRTLESLRKRGLVTDAKDGISLTAGGKIAYDRIMASGDGPESLKELLKF